MNPALLDSLKAQDDLRALTIRQPWASAFIHGTPPKRVENRSWKPPRWLLGSWFVIHAGKSIERQWVQRLAERELLNVDPVEYPLGAIVAVARCCEVEPPSWFPSGSWRADNQWGILVDVVIPLDPIPCKGALSLWKVGPEKTAQILEQLEARL